MAQAADADVVFRLVEGNERECVTGCSEPAVRIITVSTPDKKAVASLYMCEAHGQAASNDRTNAKLDLGVEREFSDPKLGGDPEKIRQLEPIVTSPDVLWKSIDLVDRKREPIARNTLERGQGQQL